MTKRKLGGATGTVWVNDGQRSKRLKAGARLPKGWAAGRLPTPGAKPAPPSRAVIVTESMLSRSRGKPSRSSVNPFTPAKPPPGVVPDGATIAMDEAVGAQGWAVAAANNFLGGLAAEGQVFLGYPELAVLAQRAEFRRISETIATEMTRKWIEITATGDEDRTEKVHQLTAEMDRLNVQGVFRRAAEQDGFFGRGHIYVDVGTTDDRNELKTPIGDGRDEISRAKIGKGSLKRLKAVEAVWCYPSHYNSTDPLQPDWYRPSTWFVQGKEVHASRLLTFIGREVPDLLKPAYAFGGLSMSQMAKSYVENWLRTQQSVSDILYNFSVSGLKTTLDTTLQPGAEDALYRRVDLMANLRSNRGILLLNKETEDWFNISTPLSGLDLLQAQTQEHMAAVSGIPLVKLLGIQPTGLNADSEGVMRSFYDWIAAYQLALFLANLNRVFAFVQLSLWGVVDPDLTYRFLPLKELDEKEKAEVRKVEAETDEILINAGALSSLDSRKRVAADKDSPYASLDVDDVPVPPEGEHEDDDLDVTEPDGDEVRDAA